LALATELTQTKTNEIGIQTIESKDWGSHVNFKPAPKGFKLNLGAVGNINSSSRNDIRMIQQYSNRTVDSKHSSPRDY